jgi:hypothetical protein
MPSANRSISGGVATGTTSAAALVWGVAAAQ